MCHQVCTGKLPFPVDNVAALIADKNAGPATPPGRILPGLPSEYQTTTMRAQSVPSRERYSSSAAETHAAIAALHGTS
ncbi:hypothetical protein GCM10023323_22630 [Streptomyces thinghirensis]|uniref:Uncharacterized protein n=1 Tax=Streptomyces thinghirensis TaxID=551547 RepID=A0ABP9SZJ0_9ACTN